MLTHIADDHGLVPGVFAGYDPKQISDIHDEMHAEGAMTRKHTHE